MRRLVRDERAQLVEVLPREEYEDEHLPGAINIPLKELDRKTSARLKRDAPVIVLKTCGYTDEQAYIIIGTAPVEGQVSGVVDIPNACVSIYLPTEIFKRPIVPQDVPSRVAREAQLPHAPGDPQINLTRVEVRQAPST